MDSKLKTAAKKYREVYGRVHDIISEVVEADGMGLEDIMDPLEYQRLVQLLSGPCQTADEDLKTALEEP